jgi:hypothetical protein
VKRRGEQHGGQERDPAHDVSMITFA